MSPLMSPRQGGLTREDRGLTEWEQSIANGKSSIDWNLTPKSDRGFGGLSGVPSEKSEYLQFDCDVYRGSLGYRYWVAGIE
jgi:hypothetical protein